MNWNIKPLLYGLLAAGLSLSVATAQTVPKAAENADAPVSFGDAGARPKPTAKQVTVPVAKAKSGKAASGSKAASGKKTPGAAGKKSTRKK